MHQNTLSCIPSLLTDIEATGCFCLLFVVSAWPPRPPSRLHDFTSIPSILSDIEANVCFCLLFAVSVQLPRTLPEYVILPAFLQFYLFLKPMNAFAYFPTFRLGSWRPECFSRSVLFMLFPNLSSHFVVFLFFPAVSCTFLLFQ